MLLPQLLGERRAHEATADVGGRSEVALALLAPRRGHVLVQLHPGEEECGPVLERVGDARAKRTESILARVGRNADILPEQLVRQISLRKCRCSRVKFALK